jgi:hypothetical protein
LFSSGIYFDDAEVFLLGITILGQTMKTYKNYTETIRQPFEGEVGSTEMRSLLGNTD